MTAAELNTRIEHYTEARNEGRITPKEWEAFMEALARLANKKTGR
jgi:hypothetical protein